MKEKILKVLGSKVAFAVYAMVISLLSMLQEIGLGTPTFNAVALAVVINLIIGVFVELCRKTIFGGGYKFINILPWVIGSGIGAAIPLVF